MSTGELNSGVYPAMDYIVACQRRSQGFSLLQGKNPANEVASIHSKGEQKYCFHFMLLEPG